MEELRYYRALGLPAGADAGQIKSAYRVLAKKYHPDMSKDPATGDEFRKVAAAYKTLLAREEKRSYLDSTVRRTYRTSPIRPATQPSTGEAKKSIYEIGQLLLRGKTASMRAFAARRLGFSQQKGAYVYLRKSLQDPSEAVVLAAVEAIGRLRVSISAEELEALFEGSSRPVKLAILQTVEMCGTKNVFLGILVKGMQSLDRKVRSKSLSLFSQI
ncbi:MAG: DnaJ domain-containing protein [Spirochaetia bacterium]|nr:DnaJ domain-containing protein [Spirochaetia bacterium]